jgi:hypothetical protein
VLGESGRALNLKGSGQYVSVPSTVLRDASEMTVALWINVAAPKRVWERAIDFGNGPSGYWFISPMTDQGLLRFGISATNKAGEQTMDAPALAASTWQHVAVILSTTSAEMYVNGKRAATLPALKTRLSDLGGTIQNWLGRSQYVNDPYFAGALDDLYLYRCALDADAILTLSSGEVTP